MMIPRNVVPFLSRKSVCTVGMGRPFLAAAFFFFTTFGSKEIRFASLKAANRMQIRVLLKGII